MASTTSAPELTVVGVDGSDASKAPLRWAVHYGRKSGGTVRVVAAWHIEPPFGAAGAKPDEQYEQQARTRLDKALSEVDSSQHEFRLEAQLQRGDPATVLLEQAQHADLLVFGDKGRGPVVGMLVGSVISRALRHALCPVVIVGQQMERR